MMFCCLFPPMRLALDELGRFAEPRLRRSCRDTQRLLFPKCTLYISIKEVTVIHKIRIDYFQFHVLLRCEIFIKAFVQSLFGDDFKFEYPSIEIPS